MAIALFGSMLVRQGTIKMGGRFTMIAKDLSEKFGSKECASKYRALFLKMRCQLVVLISAIFGWYLGEVYFLVSSAQCL